MESSMLLPVCPPGAPCRSMNAYTPNSSHQSIHRSSSAKPSSTQFSPGPSSRNSRALMGMRTELYPSSAMRAMSSRRI